METPHTLVSGSHWISMVSIVSHLTASPQAQSTTRKIAKGHAILQLESRASRSTMVMELLQIQSAHAGQMGKEIFFQPAGHLGLSVTPTFGPRRKSHFLQK